MSQSLIPFSFQGRPLTQAQSRYMSAASLLAVKRLVLAHHGRQGLPLMQSIKLIFRVRSRSWWLVHSRCVHLLRAVRVAHKVSGRPISISNTVRHPYLVVFLI